MEFFGPTTQILTKIFKIFDCFGCKSFFCPFYDVLSCIKVFFRFWKFWKFSNISNISTFLVANHLCAHSMMFWDKTFFSDLGNFLCPTPQILTKNFKNFDYFGCKTFFGPFYDVLSKKNFFGNIQNFPSPKTQKCSILYEKIILSHQFSNTSRDIYPVKLYLKFESICIIGSWVWTNVEVFGWGTERRTDRQKDGHPEKWLLSLADCCRRRDKKGLNCLNIHSCHPPYQTSGW